MSEFTKYMNVHREKIIYVRFDSRGHLASQADTEVPVVTDVVGEATEMEMEVPVAVTAVFPVTVPVLLPVLLPVLVPSLEDLPVNLRLSSFSSDLR